VDASDLNDEDASPQRKKQRSGKGKISLLYASVNPVFG
jgi:hypothetical protein